MKLTNKNIQKFRDMLKKENLKFTDQRFLIYKTLFENKGHFDCEEIILLLPKKIKVSRATTYRTLDLLVKNNLARKIILDDGVARYEKKTSNDHHDHMICIETGKIIEFYDEEIENIQDQIAKKLGYKIVKHIHQLFVKKIKS